MEEPVADNVPAVTVIPHPHKEPARHTWKRTPEQLERYDRNRLYCLRAMPPRLFAACVERLGRGDPPISVARWQRQPADFTGCHASRLCRRRRRVAGLRVTSHRLAERREMPGIITRQDVLPDQ